MRIFHLTLILQKLRRLVLNTIQLKENDKENTNTRDKVLIERQFQIDAAIVRVLKFKKEINHQELFADSAKLLLFPITNQEFKIRIEKLIEQDYMERHSANKNM